MSAGDQALPLSQLICTPRPTHLSTQISTQHGLGYSTYYKLHRDLTRRLDKFYAFEKLLVGFKFVLFQKLGHYHALPLVQKLSLLSTQFNTIIHGYVSLHINAHRAQQQDYCNIISTKLGHVYHMLSTFYTDITSITTALVPHWDSLYEIIDEWYLPAPSSRCDIAQSSSLSENEQIPSDEAYQNLLTHYNDTPITSNCNFAAPTIASHITIFLNVISSYCNSIDFLFTAPLDAFSVLNTIFQQDKSYTITITHKPPYFDFKITAFQLLLDLPFFLTSWTDNLSPSIASIHKHLPLIHVLLSYYDTSSLHHGHTNSTSLVQFPTGYLDYDDVIALEKCLSDFGYVLVSQLTTDSAANWALSLIIKHVLKSSPHFQDLQNKYSNVLMKFTSDDEASFTNLPLASFQLPLAIAFIFSLSSGSNLSNLQNHFISEYSDYFNTTLLKISTEDFLKISSPTLKPTLLLGTPKHFFSLLASIFKGHLSISTSNSFSSKVELERALLAKLTFSPHSELMTSMKKSFLISSRYILSTVINNNSVSEEDATEKAHITAIFNLLVSIKTSRSQNPQALKSTLRRTYTILSK